MIPKLINKKIQTNSSSDIIELTPEIKQCIIDSNVTSGLCTIFTPHTTAGLTITSFWDKNGFEDLKDEVNRLVPTRINFKHQHDTPQDAAGHVKSSLIGVNLSLIIDNGQLLLGHSQGIYFFEFDGPRKRQYYIQVMAN